MGYNDAGSVFHNPAYGFMNFIFSDVIRIGRCFIEYENRRVADEDTGEVYQLFFSDTKVDSVVEYFKIKALFSFLKAPVEVL